MSNSLWAYAKLGYNPGREVLDVTAQRAVQSLPQYTSQEIANTLWALATLEHHPGVQLLDASAVQIARRIEQFSPQDTTNSVWAYAKLFHYPCNDLLQSAAMYCLRHWHRCGLCLQLIYIQITVSEHRLSAIVTIRSLWMSLTLVLSLVVDMSVFGV